MANDPTAPQNTPEPDATPGFVDFTEELLKHAESAPKADPAPAPKPVVEEFVAAPSRRIASGVEDDEFEVRTVNKMSDAAWKKKKKVDVQRMLSFVLLGLAAIAVFVYVVIGGSPKIETPPPPAPTGGATNAAAPPAKPANQNPVLPLDNTTPAPQPMPPPGGAPMHEQPMDDAD